MQSQYFAVPSRPATLALSRLAAGQSTGRGRKVIMLAAIFSLTGLVGLFGMWHFWGRWVGWALVACFVIRAMGYNAAQYAHARRTIAPPAIIALDTIATLFTWGAALYALWDILR